MPNLRMIFALLLLSSAAAHASDYAIVVSQSTANDASWKPVVEALVAKHKADHTCTVITYDKSVHEAKAALGKLHPRYACFVATSSEAGRQFVADVHRLTRTFDDDPWTDCIWGILTGFDADNALAIAQHAKPLTVRKVASGTEIALDMVPEGLWYDELVKHKKVAKQRGGEAEQTQGPADTTHALAETLTDYKADLFVTSGHATERDWMIGFRYRNGFFKSKNGQMFGETVDKQRFPITSDNPKVYLPIGNCLMGHIDAPDAMALAWMNSCGVKQMIGYTVPTWYGYAGWGLLDYFVEQPGRYTMAEAFIANHHALLHRLYTALPQAKEMNVKPGSSVRVRSLTPAAQKMGLRAMDITGLLHDRDVVAFYGDPAWIARTAPGPVAYVQKLTHNKEAGTYTFTITPKRGADSFKPINTNGAQRGWRPIVHLLPHRLTDIEVTNANGLNPLVADDFILIPNPRQCDPKRAYVVTFKARVVE